MKRYTKKKPTKMERMVKTTSIIMVLIMLSSLILGLVFSVQHFFR